MKHALLFTGLLVALTGCATVESDTSTTVTLNGRETELRKRTYTVNGELRETYSVRSQNGSFRQCDPNMAGSCERAARSNAGGNGR